MIIKKIKNQIDNNDIMTINKMNNSIIINNNNEAKKGDIYYEMKKAIIM